MAMVAGVYLMFGLALIVAMFRWPIRPTGG